MSKNKNTQNKLLFKIAYDFSEKEYAKWLKLWEKAENANFYNSPMWFRVCIETFNYKKVRLIECIHNGKLVALLPIHNITKFGINLWTTPLSNEPLLLLKSDNDIPRRFIKYLRTIDNIILFELQEDFMKALGVETLSVYSSDRPYISIDEVKKELVSRSFKKIRTRMRNIGSTLNYVWKTPTEKDLEVVKEIEKKSSKIDTASDIFSLPIMNDLYKNFINIVGENTRIGLMYEKNIPVVSDFYLVGRKVAHSTHTSYDKEYSNYWPGNLLQYKVLEDFIKQEDIEEVDLGRGVNALKLKFATGIRKYYTTYLILSPIKFIYIMSFAKLERFAYRLKENNRFISAFVLKTKKLLKAIN